MAINRITPQTDIQSLVGRYVLRDAGYLYAAVSGPVKVVGAKSKTLKVETVPRWFCAQDKRWVVGFNPYGETREVEAADDLQIRSVVMACDTLEEVDSLMLLNSQAHNRFHEFLNSTKVELDAMVTEDLAPDLKI